VPCQEVAVPARVFRTVSCQSYRVANVEEPGSTRSSFESAVCGFSRGACGRVDRGAAANAYDYAGYQSWTYLESYDSTYSTSWNLNAFVKDLNAFVKDTQDSDTTVTFIDATGLSPTGRATGSPCTAMTKSLVQQGVARETQR
jgi:hypothetical protein